MLESQNNRKYSGLEKSAIVLMKIKNPGSGKILQLFTSSDLQKLCLQISKIGVIEKNDASDILESFTKRLEEIYSIGSIQNVKSIISTLGEQEQEKILQAIDEDVWKKFSSLDSKSIVSFLEKERPQIAAIILSNLKSTLVMDIIANINQDKAVKIIIALSKRKDMDDGVARSVEKALKYNINKILLSKEEQSIVDIFNNLNHETEEILFKGVKTQDPDLAKFIKDNLFKFEDIIKLSADNVKILANNINKDSLKFALQTASEAVKKLFFDGMSERAARIVKNDIELSKATAKREEISASQIEIAQKARELIKSGILHL